MSFLDGNYDLHESQRIEFKEASNGLPTDVWETYSAFANTEGGEIVLGFHEDKASETFVPVGVKDGRALMDDYWNTVRNPTKVARDVTLVDGVRLVNRDGRDFVVITVPRAERDDKPVTVYDRKARGFVAWVRRGAGDYRASDEDLRLMAHDSVPSADRQPLERFDLKALSTDTIERYRRTFATYKPTSPWNFDSQDDFFIPCRGSGQGSRREAASNLGRAACLWARIRNHELSPALPARLPRPSARQRPLGRQAGINGKRCVERQPHRLLPTGNPAASALLPGPLLDRRLRNGARLTKSRDGIGE